MKNEELLEQIYESNLNRIKELLGEGVDINNINETKDSNDIIKLLLEFGANLNIKDRDGENAYEFAKGYHIPAQKLFESVIKNNKNNN